MIHLLLALCFCALQHHCFAAYPGLVYYIVFLTPLPARDRHGIAIISRSDPYLLLSTWFTLSRVNLDGSNYSVLVDSATNVGIQAVDYHQRYPDNYNVMRVYTWCLNLQVKQGFLDPLYGWDHSPS